MAEGEEMIFFSLPSIHVTVMEVKIRFGPVYLLSSHSFFLRLRHVYLLSVDFYA